jgi:hypothetical protein
MVQLTDKQKYEETLLLDDAVKKLYTLRQRLVLVQENQASAEAARDAINVALKALGYKESG